jgi:hypothetical protein
MKTKISIAFLFIIMALVGCSPVYYVPNAHNVPILDHKGQGAIYAGLDATDAAEGVNIQSAFAVSDAVGVQLNGFFTNGSAGDGKGSGEYIELGIGYYKKLPFHFVFETYSLFGFGNMHNDYDKDSSSPNGRISANLFKIGIQPSISYKRKYFTLSLSNKISHLSYSSIRGDLYFSETGSETAYLESNKNNFLIEPAFSVSAGLKDVKLQFQFQNSYNLTHPRFKQDDFVFSMGLKYDFDLLK